ncbi:MAG TPA: DUF2461 domain-containing protein [Gammaproteobacteria bacterium]|nr:DUF2461 domain-containing protein [Gammaproteobacteria bacterium]
MAQRFFTPATFKFLKNLQANNNRVWFDEHKQEYEDAVRTPALNFIDAMADDIADISPHFRAIAKKVGGSLMRVHRDVRFGHDKRPYKTNIGIQFRHARGKDVHAPGFYVHLEPKECFLGVGIWHPDAPALDLIRSAIAQNSAAWMKASRDKSFSKLFAFSGDALANAPRGYAKDHPMLEDLKRKDFIAIQSFPQTLATTDHFQSDVVKSFRTSKPLMTFLCQALELPI